MTATENTQFCTALSKFVQSRKHDIKLSGIRYSARHQIVVVKSTTDLVVYDPTQDKIVALLPIHRFGGNVKSFGFDPDGEILNVIVTSTRLPSVAKLVRLSVPTFDFVNN